MQYHDKDASFIRALIKNKQGGGRTASVSRRVTPPSTPPPEHVEPISLPGQGSSLYPADGSLGGEFDTLESEKFDTWLADGQFWDSVSIWLALLQTSYAY